MARYRGPKCRLCRREGVALFLKGDKCFTEKCPVNKRKTPPGMHGDQGNKKVSDYGVRLREKQKARRIYGVLEKQFSAYFDRATRMPGLPGENLLQLLERRLDNVVFRMGFGQSRDQARQVVCHGLVMVDGRRVNIPSYLVKPGQSIEIKNSKRDAGVIVQNAQDGRARGRQAWMESGTDSYSTRIVSVPARTDIDTKIEEQLIVEYYSR
ncbi:MAG TPA: 30S ribosomal protein S4 [Abditibacteriaceae bacterium]|nr:30S ribosomal protein S4 [Abditibacteriaceae bacterium]